MNATFSKNLFWDADERTLDLQRNRKYVVQRVLERGTVQDLRTAFDYYGLAKVVETAKSLRSLEPTATHVRETEYACSRKAVCKG